jgi:hypothetical protein
MVLKCWVSQHTNKLRILMIHSTLGWAGTLASYAYSALLKQRRWISWPLCSVFVEHCQHRVTAWVLWWREWNGQWGFLSDISIVYKYYGKVLKIEDLKRQGPNFYICKNIEVLFRVIRIKNRNGLSHSIRIIPQTSPSWNYGLIEAGIRSGL